MIKKIFSISAIVLGIMSLSACSWETYTKKDGSRGLQQTTPRGAAVYYEDGTYSSNQRFNQYRPVRHVEPHVNPELEPEVENTHWDKSQLSN